MMPQVGRLKSQDQEDLMCLAAIKRLALSQPYVCVVQKYDAALVGIYHISPPSDSAYDFACGVSMGARTALGRP
jgi:hypothetical protein